MSIHRYQDDCPNCRPAIIDPKTGKKLPDTAPEMISVLAIWSTTTRREREAFHNVTCMQAPNPEDRRLFTALSRRIAIVIHSIRDTA